MLERSIHVYIWRWVDWNAEGAEWGNSERGALDASPGVTENSDAVGKQCTLLELWLQWRAVEPGQQQGRQFCPPTRGDGAHSPMTREAAEAPET